MGHEWHHQPPIGVDSETHGWTKPHSGTSSAIGLGSVCAMCGMERIRWVLRSGEVLPARYRPPEGYARHGDDRLTVGEWRQTHIATLFPDFLVKPKAPRRLAAAS
jgi:hypothetical protein